MIYCAVILCQTCFDKKGWYNPELYSFSGKNKSAKSSCNRKKKFLVLLCYATTFTI